MNKVFNSNISRTLHIETEIKLNTKSHVKCAICELLDLFCLSTQFLATDSFSHKDIRSVSIASHSAESHGCFDCLILTIFKHLVLCHFFLYPLTLATLATAN